MSTIINMIAAMPKNITKSELHDLVTRIGAIEYQRVQLEAKYLPVKYVKISTVQLETARAWLLQHSQLLEVDKVGPLWTVVGLNDIEIGLLREKHIEGFAIDPNEKPVIHIPFENIVDYERIG